MSTFNRKSTPRVKRGRVQKKNNWEETPELLQHVSGSASH